MKSQLSDRTLRRLLDAGRALVAHLDLERILDELLEVAADVTGARYVAIGVLNDSRTALDRFITRGVDEETHRKIGDLPRGRGVLGVLIADPHPLRLENVGEHPESYGFPAGHPRMKTFLGVPVKIRGEVWGNLYLTEKDGGEPFSAADEEALLVVADWAGIAVDNARLYESVQSQRDELRTAVRGLSATTAIARAVGSETDLDRVLELIVKRGRALVDAQAVRLLLEDDGKLRLAATAGAEVSDDSEPSALRVPLVYREARLGVLVVYARPGEADGYGDDEARVLEAFAASAATAVATARNVERERLRHSLQAAERERRRWARELHDETLQGLAGLRVLLASGLRSGDPAAAESAAREAVERIAGEVEKLRTLITELRPAALDELGLEPALQSLIGRLATVEGLEATLEADLGSERLEPELETTVYRLVQESLSNVAKHARAERVRVAISRAGDDVHLEVVDDGRGFDPSTRSEGFGLVGMRERAALAGGELDVVASEAGTTVRARLPAPG